MHIHCAACARVKQTDFKINAHNRCIFKSVSVELYLEQDSTFITDEKRGVSQVDVYLFFFIPRITKLYVLSILIVVFLLEINNAHSISPKLSRAML